MTGREPESSRDLRKDPREASVEPVPVVTKKIVGESADVSNDLLVGRLLRGTYRITATLDEGGMGRLYRAEHQRLRRPVAVKVMARYLSANPEALARFRREAEIVVNPIIRTSFEILDFDTQILASPILLWNCCRAKHYPSPRPAANLAAARHGSCCYTNCERPYAGASHRRCPSCA